MQYRGRWARVGEDRWRLMLGVAVKFVFQSENGWSLSRLGSVRFEAFVEYTPAHTI